jgi:phosphomannomutase
LSDPWRSERSRRIKRKITKNDPLRNENAFKTDAEKNNIRNFAAGKRGGYNHMNKLVVFDLDGTLAASKSPIDAETAALLHDLLGLIKVAVISGGDWLQFDNQVVSRLPHDDRLKNLCILPACGTKFYQYDGAWKKLYSEDFTTDEKKKIKDSLKREIAAADFGIDKFWGEVVEDRGSQITFSALGQKAPLEEKEKWDPDFAKRKKLQAMLDEDLPEFSIRLGGTTSVDITKRGIDKAYGIRKLKDTLGIAIDEMIFVGDALFPGGNDYPAEKTNVVFVPVHGPRETKRVIKAMIACLESDRHADISKFLTRAIK